MKIRSRDIVLRAVEEGVVEGIRLAYKHTDTPSERQLQDAIEHAVMAELDDVIDWEDGLASEAAPEEHV